MTKRHKICGPGFRCPSCLQASDESRAARRAFKKSAVAIGLSLNMDYKTAAELAERCTRSHEATLPTMASNPNCWNRRPA